MNVQLRWGFWTFNLESSYLRFLYEFFKPWGRGYGFLSGFPRFSFTVHSNWTVETLRGCVSLKKYKSQGKTVEVTVNSKKENSKTFVWVLTKNSASVTGSSQPWTPHPHFLFHLWVRVLTWLNLGVSAGPWACSPGQSVAGYPHRAQSSSLLLHPVTKQPRLTLSYRPHRSKVLESRSSSNS
jgi:hypothetical protein